MMTLIASLMPGSSKLLKPETLAMMMTNHLPGGVSIRLLQNPVKGKGFGLGGAVTVAASSMDPPGSAGEFQWGGMAGTHWWIHPRHGVAGIVMAQREMAFWHPFSFELKAAVYRSLGLSEAR
jgi:CubicO group peptidase (beta-lactamase class C family)